GLDERILLVRHPRPHRLGQALSPLTRQADHPGHLLLRPESKGSANHPHWRVSARITDNVSWPFSGGSPSMVSPNASISLEASASRSGSCCRAASIVWYRPMYRARPSSDPLLWWVSFHSKRS